MSDETLGQPGTSIASGRRLAAVLHADVVGFSRLMAEDEQGTHARLLAHRDVLYEELRAHRGQVIGTAGDAVLAIFDSVVDALSGAIAIQEKLGAANANLPPETRLAFRIGLNIGDIIVDGDDVFGNGVNVAARTEALADPGGIAVSAAVKEQVGNTLSVVFEDRGTHAVKNIATPLHVYAVVLGETAPRSVQQPTPERQRGGRGKAVLALLVVVALCAGGVAAYFFAGSGAGERASTAPQDTQTAALDPLQKPTIAVLPFGNRGAADDSYFGDGVTEEIIGSLGRFSDLLVLSWSAVAPYKARTVEVTQLASDLEADYAVSGSIQRADDKIRISVQLSDTSNGVLIWSERYDAQLTDVFEVQDRLVRQVVSALAVRVTLEEETRVASIPTESMTAYDQVLRGRDLLRVVSRDANLGARDLFERALEADPGYADALVALGQTHLNDLAFGWTFRPRSALDTATAFAREAIERDPFHAGAFELLASTQKCMGNLEEAERSINRSLELNPNSATGQAERCSIQMFAGQPHEALQASDLALKLDPYPRSDQLNCPVMTNLMLGNYEAALQVFQEFPERVSEEPASLVARAAAHAMLGQAEQAAKYKAEALARYPFIRSEQIAQIVKGAEYQQTLYDAFKKAGFD